MGTFSLGSTHKLPSHFSTRSLEIRTIPEERPYQLFNIVDNSLRQNENGGPVDLNI